MTYIARLARRVLIAAVLSVAIVSGPSVVMAATSKPAQQPVGYSCVITGALSPRASCNRALQEAIVRWPRAGLALNGQMTGDGSWIVPASDGLHFDLVTVDGGVGSHSELSRTASSGLRFGTDVYALNVVASGSGRLNTSGYSCGSRIGWWRNVWYDTNYGAHVEMDTTGHLTFCQAAYTDTITPIARGAGSWTDTQGIIGNGSTKTNPWMNWDGSIWACCSDTVLERIYMDAWGNWSWTVYH